MTSSKNSTNYQWIFGYHAVQSLLKTDADSAIELHCVRARRDQRSQKTQQLANHHNIAINFIEFDQITTLVHSNQHQGVALKIKKNTQHYDESWLFKRLKQPQERSPLILVLDQVTDPHNLGAILRSADGAGVMAVIAPRDNACGITPVVRKVASGAVDSIPFILVTNLARTLNKLQDSGLWLTGLDDAESTVYTEHDFTGATVIVVGAEGSGMRLLTKRHCDYLVKIPMLGAVNSLNVSVATAVVLYEVVRQRSS